ncbi:hypothetical protein [Alcaligenes sp. Marseille-Q7550]
MKLKVLAAVISAGLLQACAYKGHIDSVSGAAEIMPTRRLEANAEVRFEPELLSVSQRVNTGFICGAHNYTITPGVAIADSIMRTLEGAFKQVVRIDSQQTTSGAYFLDFSLDDFSPRLRFNPGFWMATPEANVDLSIRVRAWKDTGELAFQTTARGQGRHEDGSGGCGDGMPVVEQATRQAVQRAMEDLVQKLINSRALTDT